MTKYFCTYKIGKKLCVLDKDSGLKKDDCWEAEQFGDDCEFCTKEESYNMTKPQLKEILNLGMIARQGQLNGYEQRSGNEILDKWIDKHLKATV